MKKKAHDIPDEIIQIYENLAQTIPGLQVKGAAMPYTSHNGHMFSFLDKAGNLSLRLPAAERNAFMEKFKTGLTEAHGTVLKEYVTIPENVLSDKEILQAYFAASFTYVSSLKPKPAKK
jgi:hypothetical protein